MNCQDCPIAWDIGNGLRKGQRCAKRRIVWVTAHGQSCQLACSAIVQLCALLVQFSARITCLLPAFIVGLEKRQLGMLTKLQTKRVVIDMHGGQGVNKWEGKKRPQAMDSVTFAFDWTANATTTLARVLLGGGRKVAVSKGAFQLHSGLGRPLLAYPPSSTELLLSAWSSMRNSLMCM